MNSNPAIPDSPNNRILLIDDNRAIHEDFKKIFAGENDQGLDSSRADLFGSAESTPKTDGFILDSAFQGQEGLQRVEQACAEGRPYAMAFVDMRMPPGWDGVETITRIWAVYPDLQVVICTAYSDYTLDDMIAKLGRTDRFVLLKKPFDNAEVLQLANALTAQWHLLQQIGSHVNELEERVRERTKEIESAHAKLQAEMEGRNAMEVQLRHAQKMESIGQLAAGIAHEINTPTQYIGDNTRFVQDAFGDISRLLAEYDKLFSAAEAGTVTPEALGAVKAAATTADMTYLSVEIPKAIQQSLDGVDRVAKIVRSMKDFSHPGTNEKTSLDLNRAIESTLTVCRNEWKYVAELVTEFDDELPLVNCLPGEFNQVILNLIVNAAHAIADVVGDSGTKGTITVSTKLDGEWIEVRIRDTGTGIPEHARDKVFDPFFTTKGVGKGTGQGLAIAHNVIVEKHGGTVHFETETGQGTTFVIRLPLRSASQERKAA